MPFNLLDQINIKRIETSKPSLDGSVNGNTYEVNTTSVANLQHVVVAVVIISQNLREQQRPVMSRGNQKVETEMPTATVSQQRPSQTYQDHKIQL